MMCPRNRVNSNSSLQRGTDGPPAREVGEEVFGGTKAELVDAGIGSAMHAGESGHGSLVHTVTLHGLPGCYLWCGPRFQRSRNEKGLADEYLLTLGTTGGEGGIRTLDTENRIPDFESGAFDHSATSPVFVSNCEFYHRSTALTDATPPGRPGTVATRQESRCCRRLVDGFPARRPTPAPRPGQSRSMYAPARSCPPRS